MSTVYYLIDNQKKKEIDNYIKFWNSLMKDLTVKISDYCEKENGVYINNDFAEKVVYFVIPKIKNEVPYDDEYMMRIGHAIWDKNFVWNNFYVDGHLVNDKESFIKIFNSEELKEKYSISEEGYNNIDIDYFIKNII